VRDRLELSDLLYLRQVNPVDVANFAVERDWILFVASNGNPDRIGDSVFIENDRPMLFASFLQGITSRDSSELLPPFLARWLRLHMVHQLFSKTSQQTTGLANFSWSAVKNLPVRYPADVGEQKAILQLLDAVDLASTRLDTLLNVTDRLRKSLLQQVFSCGLTARHQVLAESRIGPVPRHWEVMRLSQLIESIDAGTSPQCEAHPARPGHWGVLKVSAVSWDSFDDQENKELPPTIEPDPGVQVRAGDLIVSRANTTGLCGAAQIVRRLDSKLLLCDKTWRVTPMPGIDPEWLVLLLKSSVVRRQIEANATGTSDSMKNISRRDFGRMWVPVPPEIERSESVEVGRGLDAFSDSLIAQRHSLQKLARSLLENLLGGKVRVADMILA
jgi:type I restriction enzyme S subunit